MVKLSWYSDILKVKYSCYSNTLLEKMSCALEKDMQKSKASVESFTSGAVAVAVFLQWSLSPTDLDQRI